MTKAERALASARLLLDAGDTYAQGVHAAVSQRAFDDFRRPHHGSDADRLAPCFQEVAMLVAGQIALSDEGATEAWIGLVPSRVPHSAS